MASRLMMLPTSQLETMLGEDIEDETAFAIEDELSRRDYDNSDPAVIEDMRDEMSRSLLYPYF